MIYLSQRDPKWVNEKLGQSSLTVGRYGCTTTCISMLSDYFGCYKSPIVLAHNVANYTKEGLVIWQNLSFPKMKFVKRTFGENMAEIVSAMKDNDRAVMLNVSDGAHWVVGLSKKLLGNDYVMLDPWTGAKGSVKAVYRNVTGAAFFERT